MPECSGYCEFTDEFVVVGAGSSSTAVAGTGGFVIGQASVFCPEFVSRTGDVLFGCPGEPSSESLGLAPGYAGVLGNWPATIRFASPQTVGVGSIGPVRVQSSSSEVGISSSYILTGVWSADAATLWIVGPALLVLSAVALVVTLSVRWTQRVRSV